MRSKQILQTRAMQKYENSNSCQFFKIGVVKSKKDIGARKNKTKQNKYFAIIRKNKAVSITLRLRQIHWQL